VGSGDSGGRRVEWRSFAPGGSRGRGKVRLADPLPRTGDVSVDNLEFAAIDFETANRDPRSACSVGVVRVLGGQVVDRLHILIKPASRRFTFTNLHGIAAADVLNAPRFPEVWHRILPILSKGLFVVAHNARFDAGVIAACCQEHELRSPDVVFHCTLKWARDRLGIRPTNLGNVCTRLGIPLNHHDPLSDAEAAARIALRVLAQDL